VAAFISALLSVSKDQLIFRQRKAEELFLAVDHWDKFASGLFLLHCRHIKGMLNKDHLNDLIIETNERNADIGKDHARMFMLTKFYFPQLEPILTRYDEARSAVMEAAAAFEKNKGGLEEFDTALTRFDEASKRFKEEIIRHGKSYSDLEIFGEARRSFIRALQSIRRK
jgi:hypothetical protein